MTPAPPRAENADLWTGDPKPRKNDRLIPFATEIAYRDGRVVALRRAYRVTWPIDYDRRKAR